MSKERQATVAEFMGLKPYPERDPTPPTPTPVTDALYAESEMYGVKIERLWNHARKIEAQALESNQSWAQRWAEAMQAHHDKKILSAWCYDLRAALKMLLPLAESYLKNAPSNPDNAKLETARGALAKTHHLEAL